MNKLQANRLDIEPDTFPAAIGLTSMDPSSDDAITHSIRIIVFRGVEYLGEKSFSQDRIVIGKSLDADLVIPDSELADHQVCVTFLDGQLVALDQTQKTGLLIKGVLHRIAIIQSSEQIGMGPYILKISHHKKIGGQESTPHISHDDNYNKDIRISAKTDVPFISEGKRVDSLKTDQKDIDQFEKEEEQKDDLSVLFEGSPEQDHELYDLVFEGEIQAGFDIANVKSNLSKLFKSDLSRIDQFLNRKRVVLKSSLERDVAEKYQKVFEKSGAVCRLIAHESRKSQEFKTQEEELNSPPATIPEQRPDENIAKVQSEKEKNSDSFQREEKAVWKFYGVNVDEEDEEDEEDLPADFYLKDKIDYLNKANSQQNSTSGKYLEILKLHGDDVIDVEHLKEKSKFYISNDRGKRFRLAEFKGVNEALFYFNDKVQGRLEADGRPPVETRILMKEENCLSKRKRIYRTKIPNKGKVVISDGYFEYQMRKVSQSFVPQAAEIKKNRKKTYKHLAISLVFHIFFLAFLGLFPSFQGGKKVEDETRFVKLDSKQLAELEKMVNPQPEPKPPAPKPKPPEAKPIPEKKVTKPKPIEKPKVEKKTKPKVLKKQPVKIASNKKPTKVKTAGSPKSHPNAGGGAGKGNVETRDINETGILSMLGDKVGIQPQNALAAVTNLDAVSSPQVTTSNFKVGGVVGELGTGEIAVPKGAIITTKGSSQVLRSHGSKGEGRIAALEKGTTGEKEVMGMVTAKLDKSARVRGGLSMEAVKRVIDQHLDDITYCYETELISNPSIVGKVLFEWKIMMSGEVGEVRIKSSSINSHEIHACIKESIRTWHFPKPRGSEVMVSYPFVFDIVGF